MAAPAVRVCVGRGVGLGIGLFVGLSSTAPASSGLLDLDDLFGGGGAPSNSSAATAPMTGLTSMLMPASTAGVAGDTDLLSLPPAVMEATATVTPVTPFPPAPVPGTGAVGDMTSPIVAPSPASVPSVSVVSAAAPVGAPTPVVIPAPVVIFDKASLRISVQLNKPDPQDTSVTELRCHFTNRSTSPLTALVFQAAVPKYLKLEMHPPSSTTIPASSEAKVTQKIVLRNSMQGTKSIMLKVKVGYALQGERVEEIHAASNFPALY